MAINMMCLRSECKYYFEDCCERNWNDERIKIDAYGYCQTFEAGVNEMYTCMDRAEAEEIQEG